MSAARKPNTAGSLPAAVVDRPGRSRGPWVARLDSARPGVNALIDQRQRLEREFRPNPEEVEMTPYPAAIRLGILFGGAALGWAIVVGSGFALARLLG